MKVEGIDASLLEHLPLDTVAAFVVARDDVRAMAAAEPAPAEEGADTIPCRARTDQVLAAADNFIAQNGDLLRRLSSAPPTTAGALTREEIADYRRKGPNAPCPGGCGIYALDATRILDSHEKLRVQVERLISYCNAAILEAQKRGRVTGEPLAEWIARLPLDVEELMK